LAGNSAKTRLKGGFCFMYHTYILYSPSLDKYYVGYTGNIELRIERHNSSWGKFTSQGIPWKLVYKEKFDTISDAIKRENEIKRKKSRKYIEALISHAGGRPA
jgi:putative endonuclease